MDVLPTGVAVPQAQLQGVDVQVDGIPVPLAIPAPPLPCFLAWSDRKVPSHPHEALPADLGLYILHLAPK